MRILAIESSCDETAAAVVEDGRNVLSSVVASQVEEHKLYGGVVPEIASRRHAEAIVGTQMVYRNQGQACRHRQPLGEIHPHQQGADQPWGMGHRHGIHLP